jgi:hypothetical protein
MGFHFPESKKGKLLKTGRIQNWLRQQNNFAFDCASAGYVN